MGPSSDHCVRLLELGIGHLVSVLLTFPFDSSSGHDEYQVRGKEADKIILRVF